MKKLPQKNKNKTKYNETKNTKQHRAKLKTLSIKYNIKKLGKAEGFLKQKYSYKYEWCFYYYNYCCSNESYGLKNLVAD